jgi:hypothetical protein
VFESEYLETGGAPQIYRQQYYLIEESGWKEYQTKKKITRKYLTSIYEKQADESAEIEKETKKGKPLRIELRRWKQMKMRTKRGNSMKEVEFEIVAKARVASGNRRANIQARCLCGGGWGKRQRVENRRNRGSLLSPI